MKTNSTRIFPGKVFQESIVVQALGTSISSPFLYSSKQTQKAILKDSSMKKLIVAEYRAKTCQLSSKN